MKEMNIVVSEDKACFSNYFRKQDLEKMKALAKSLGYESSTHETDRKFKDEIKIFKKIVIRDIDWADPRTILYVIKNRHKDDVTIVKGLKSKGSGFSITVQRGRIMTAHSDFLESINGHPTEEQLENFAKEFALKYKTTTKGMIRKIEKLIDAGCVVGETTYPECENGFHEGCLKCPHNAKKILADKAYISEFNRILDAEFED